MAIKHYGFGRSAYGTEPLASRAETTGTQREGLVTNALKALAYYEGIPIQDIDVGDVFGDKSLLPQDFMAAFPLGQVRKTTVKPRYI